MPKSERTTRAALGISRKIDDTQLTCLIRARSTKIVLEQMLHGLITGAFRIGGMQRRAGAPA